MPGAKRSEPLPGAVCGVDNRPLSGRRILVTRAADQCAPMAEALAALGAEPVLCPTIGIVPPASYAELDAQIGKLGETDFLILTSVNAVEAFFARLEATGNDVRTLAGVTLVAVGPKTAEALAAHGLKADLLPASYNAEGVVALLRDRVAGKRVLYPRAALARDLIVRELTGAGAGVAAPEAYSSATPAEAPGLAQKGLQEGLDLLTFTASSTVRNFAGLLDPAQLALARRVPAAVIGPQTADTARQLGFSVAVAPAEATIDAMVAAIVSYFQGLPAQPAPGN